MRTSEWAVTFKLTAKSVETRPDNPTGDIVYRVKDIFTTRDGSWEPTPVYGGIPAWARDTYLRPWGAPDYFDDAGGDHHLFARVLDQNGQPIKSSGLIRYWSDGFAKLSDSSYQNYIQMTPKAGSGWANMDIYNGYNPEGGEIGAWCWCPAGAADVVVGGGMPHKNHISTFAVWQAESRTMPVQPQLPTTGLDAIRRTLWEAVHITFNPNSAFADYARRNQLGAPMTNENDISNYRVQGFATGIVFAPIGQWQNISHMSW